MISPKKNLNMELNMVLNMRRVLADCSESISELNHHDLLAQSNWPHDHVSRVPELINQIENISGVTSVRMEWASGLMLVVKMA